MLITMEKLRMDDEILILIRDCQTRARKLNCWEKDFIVNIEQQYHKKRTLSDAQKEALDKIWEKATS